MIYEFNDVKYDVNTKNDFLGLYSTAESIGAEKKTVFFSKDEEIGYADKLLYQIKLEATKHYNIDKYKYNNIIYIHLNEIYRDADGNEYEIKKNINIGAYIGDSIINHISDGGVGSLISVTGEIINNNLSTIKVKDFHLYIAYSNVKKNDETVIETGDFEVPVFYGTGFCNVRLKYTDYYMDNPLNPSCYIEQIETLEEEKYNNNVSYDKDNKFLGVYINKIVNVDGLNIFKFIYPDLLINQKRIDYACWDFYCKFEYNDLYVYNDKFELIGITNKNNPLVFKESTEYFIISKSPLQLVVDKYIFIDGVTIFRCDLVNTYDQYIYNRVFEVSETSYSYAEKISNALRLWNGETNYYEPYNYNNNHSVKSSIICIILNVEDTIKSDYNGDLSFKKVLVCSAFKLHYQSFLSKYGNVHFELNPMINIVKHNNWPYYIYTLNLSEYASNTDKFDGVDKINVNITLDEYNRVYNLEDHKKIYEILGIQKFELIPEHIIYIVNSGILDNITNKLVDNQYYKWKGPEPLGIPPQ